MKINLKHITIISGLALAVGCGGDDDKKDDMASGDLNVSMDMTHVNPPDMTGATCSQTYDPSGTLITVGLQAISPETAWSGGYPFIAGVTASWYDECNAPTAVSGPGVPMQSMAAFTLTQNANTTVRPSIPESSTLLPSISDILTVGTMDLSGSAIPDHMWQKATTSTVTAVTTLVPNTTQAQLLSQGVCIFEALSAHASMGPIVEPATITISAADTAAGFHIYSIHGSDTDPVATPGVPVPTGTVTLADDNDGDLSGRFLITSPTNTAVTSVTVQATAKSGPDTFHSYSCSVIPGNVVFEPVTCIGCPGGPTS